MSENDNKTLKSSKRLNIATMSAAFEYREYSLGFCQWMKTCYGIISVVDDSHLPMAKATQIGTILRGDHKPLLVMRYDGEADVKPVPPLLVKSYTPDDDSSHCLIC